MEPFRSNFLNVDESSRFVGREGFENFERELVGLFLLRALNKAIFFRGMVGIKYVRVNEFGTS